MKMINLVIMLLTSVQIGVARDLYISSDGNDLNSGAKESPFASFDRAKEEVRRLKASGEFPEAGVTVWLREGEYRISESIELTEDDSGLPGTPVTFRAAPGEKVVLSGAVQIPNHAVQKGADTEILNRIIDKKAAARLLQIDLKSLGIHDFGKNQTRGGGARGGSREMRPPDITFQ